ncbi:MAG TPA: phosphatidate cytidylyltransferase [Phototrophicaceae bacterium]|nr:phosphatidate cytidylyltransferase [Phototrophicaceae bacterium]
MADVAKAPLSNIAQRVITALIVAPVVVIAVLIGGIAFALVVTAFAILGVVEFYVLARNRPSQGSTVIGVPMLIGVVLAFYLSSPPLLIAVLVIGALGAFALELVRHRSDVRRSFFQVGMTLAGVLYIGFPSGFLIGIRALPNGTLWLLIILCVTWSTDSFAYLGGRLWGKTPLAPRLSPKKTREGAVVGVIGGIVPGLIILALTQNLFAASVIFVLGGPFVAIAGDLFESGLKRFFQVKDSHIEGFNILPGHGGILDRTDSLLLVATFAYLCFLLLGLH